MSWWLFVGLLLIAACAHHVWRTWPRRNRRVKRDAWPRPGVTAPKGFFADSTQRGGTECAGKVG